VKYGNRATLPQCFPAQSITGLWRPARAAQPTGVVWRGGAQNRMFGR